MTQRTLDITPIIPDRYLKNNLVHGFFDVFASKTRVQSLYIPFEGD